MEQLTLYQAAEKHATHDKSPVGSRLYIYKTEAFKAGAEWQKDQCNRLIELIKEGCPVLSCEGFDDLVEQINNEIERLKDEE